MLQAVVHWNTQKLRLKRLSLRGVDDFLEDLAYNQFETTVIHAGEATRSMKSKEGVADPQRIARAEGVTRMAEAVFGDKDIALNWMRRENIALGNATPIELSATDEGAAQVRRVLSAIEHGNPV